MSVLICGASTIGFLRGLNIGNVLKILGYAAFWRRKFSKSLKK
jgi:hypothetical protein